MNEKTMKNVNLEKFATELSELIGQHIGLDHIHPSTKGRFYYIQAPEAGSPMLLHHYRGPFFIDIHPDDYDNLSSGKVSAHDYITSANWLVGYFWGGGSMIGGGYYQPLDIFSNDIRRYLKILSCRGHKSSCGYMPSEESCKYCFVEQCPFSQYKQGGNWNAEISEFDPRVELFKALRVKFEQENPGYAFKGFLCGNFPNDEIRLYPNRRYSENEKLSFTVYASADVIRSLLSREIKPEDWTAYANSFKVSIFKPYQDVSYEVTPENLEMVFEGLNLTKKQETPVEESENVNEEKEEQVTLITRVINFFKNRF